MKGLDKNVANIFGETPLDLVKDPDVKKMMKGLMEERKSHSQ